MQFHEFDALTFDCYGTLIDWEAGIVRFLEDWCRRHSVRKDPEELLSRFAEIETVCQQEAPAALYPSILARVLDRLSHRLGSPCSAEEASAFGESIGDWPPFPDSSAALADLKRRYKLVVISNIDRRSFARSQRALGVEFDAVITAEEARAYKPDERVFRYALAKLDERGIQPSRILHVAQSLFHDHVPAQAMGLKTVWINRRRGQGWGATPAPDAPVRADAEFPDMRSFSSAAMVEG